MALQNIGQMIWPTPQICGGSIALGLAVSSIAFDSATDRLFWIGRAPVTDTLTTLYLRTATVTTGCTIDVRIETVTNGRPSGTLFGTNTNINVVVADVDDNAWKTATLTAGASLSRGDEFAIVITVASGTPNMNFAGFPSETFSSASNQTPVTNAHYPLMMQDTGAGTWAFISTGFAWICQFSTAGVIPMTNMTPVDGAGTITAFNSGSSPDEYALQFVAPVDMRIAGIRAALFNVAAGADFTFSLWDSGTTDAGALAQQSQDGDFATTTSRDGFVDLLFDTPVEIAAGTTYRLGVRADTANNLSIGSYANTTVTNAMRAMHGVISTMQLATRAWTAGTAGPWTNTTTTIPLIYALIDQLDDGAGGGGGILQGGNLRGNMQ
jgi:TM2 domain-containing membrane protein YozV